MNPKVILSIVLIFFFIINPNVVKGYCWCDYSGVTPRHAFIAGVGANRKPVYIGQVLFGETLIPGKLHHDSEEIYIEYNWTAHAPSRNIKILCTKHPERLKWVKYKNGKLSELAQKYSLVEGGHDLEYSHTYIGKASSAHGTAVGKIVCKNNITECLNLHGVEKGNEYYRYKNYGVLAYVSNADTSTSGIAQFIRCIFLITLTTILIVIVIKLFRRQFKFVK